MDYAERLESVAVLGAAGKMGSGIVLLTAMEMADLRLQPENRSRDFVLHAVDVSHHVLSGLLAYLEQQARTAAEKRIVTLRGAYADRPDLVENGEIVEQYVRDVLAIVRPATVLDEAADARLIFEALPEDLDLKLKVLTSTAADRPSQPWVLTNTSSIPIEEIDRKAGLGGRIVGFHFYNPPAVQKLVELIRSRTTLPEVAEFAEALAKSLRKTVVPSRDHAGFIGNGHFVRDLLHAIAEVERIGRAMPFVEAVYTINRVSQDFLIRPMGIFQLADYVGIDVCQGIMRVMDARLPGENLHSALVDRLISMAVRGGQNSDGSQRDGFLHYEGGKPAGIFDPDRQAYVPCAAIQAACDSRIGPLPEPALSWKAAVRHATKDQALAAFYGVLRNIDTLGADLALRYGARSRQIGRQLVEDGVARSREDVNQVLLTGFFHAYGPINDYFPETVTA